MRYRTNDQNKKLHVLLTQAGLMEEKKDLIKLYSKGRTESSRELYLEEAKRLIEDLERQSGKPSTSYEGWKSKEQSEAANRMRKKIIAICYKLGWIESTDDPEERKVNMARIDLFLKERGYLKKPLKDYKPKELPKLVTQFELILKHSQEAEQNKQIKSVLQELNIPMAPKGKGRKKGK